MKRRQASIQKKTAKRKAKRRALAQMRPVGLRSEIHAAARWPLYECVITSQWDQPGEIVQLIVARRSPDGEIAAAVFLIDLGCLGVKSAFVSLFDSVEQYADLRAPIAALQPLKPIDLDLAAKIVRDAVAYAKELGFAPNRDYFEAARLLEGANPDAASTPVPLGVDGKPYFVAGPHDNVPRIIAQLTRVVGAGNFELTAPVGPPPFLIGESPLLIGDLMDDDDDESEEV